MDSSLDVVLKIREEQLRKSIRFVAVFGVFLLLSPISRAFELGWDNFFYLYVSLYLLVLGLAVFDRHLEYRVKAIITIGLAFILGIAGLLAWGLVSFGFLSLFGFCIITTMLFGIRAGILSVVLSIISTAVIGIGFITGFLSANFNTSDFLRHYSLWASSIIAIVFAAGILVVGISSMNNKLLELLKRLDDKNSQLQEANASLKESLEERQRLEFSLVKAQKMEMVGIIAGGVAHDLNNVLSGAVSYPELVLLDLPEESELRKPMEAILRSSNRAAAIVHDLLTLTRRGVLAEEVLNLNQVVKECLAGPEFEKIMRYHPGVQVEVSLDEDLCNMIGSPLHLFKTVLNLVSNAAEAMPGGGLISIETSNQFIGRAFYGLERVRAGDYAVLKISDTGSGIPENEMKRIFEPFYTKKTMGRSGTGLGMTVVWNTVKDHNGYIDITSSEGKGTSFTLFFPATTKPLEQAKPGPAVTEYMGQGESILVVDDVEDQREIASVILSTLGYSVHTVPSGESAVEYLREHSPDLVILDMIMAPGMDGLATYKEMIKLRPHQKAIIVSGFSESDQIREAQKLGAGAFILKPYTMEKIGLAVRGELGWKN